MLSYWAHQGQDQDLTGGWLPHIHWASEPCFNIDYPLAKSRHCSHLRSIRRQVKNHYEGGNGNQMHNCSTWLLNGRFAWCYNQSSEDMSLESHTRIAIPADGWDRYQEGFHNTETYCFNHLFHDMDNGSWYSGFVGDFREPGQSAFGRNSMTHSNLEANIAKQSWMGRIPSLSNCSTIRQGTLVSNGEISPARL